MSKSKKERRKRRHRHIRRSLEGTPKRPRLCVFRSNKHIYAQVIDDWNQRTLGSASSLDPEFPDELGHGGNVEAAARVGQMIGRRCLESGVDAVVFDRAGYKYHGRVKALAEAARSQFEEAGAEGF